MYATISDLLRDLFGLNIPLPIQTFGFFMAISFMLAYITTTSELRRKEKDGLLRSSMQKVTLNKRVSPADFIFNTLIGALLGYKLLHMILHYGELVEDPQGFIISTDGSAVGALVGGAIAFYMKKREDDENKKHEMKEVMVEVPPHQLMGNILLIAAIAGLLGAKIFHNLENPAEFAEDPWGTLISFSGLTFYGGLIVAAVAVLYYTHKNHIPSLHMIDAAAPGLMLAYGVGRIGCQLSGDGDWGIDNLAPKPGWMSFLPDWMWSFRYPHNVLGKGVAISGCEGPHCAQLEYPVFPTPFYEAVLGIALFFFLWNIRKRVHIPGMLFCIYLVVNGIERFFMEKIRVNSTYLVGGHHITQAEIISTLMFVAGAAGMLYFSRMHKNKLA